MIAATWLLGCGAAAPPNHTALDDLAFVDGCWHWFHIDYGVSWCWRREPDAWVGHESYGGPMAVPSDADVRIVVGPDGLEATSSGDLWRPPLAGVAESTHGPGRIRFERGSDVLELSAGPNADTLLLRTSADDEPIELARQAAR